MVTNHAPFQFSLRTTVTQDRYYSINAIESESSSHNSHSLHNSCKNYFMTEEKQCHQTSLLHGIDIEDDQMAAEDEVYGNDDDDDDGDHDDDGDDGGGDDDDDGCGEENDCELFSNLSSGQAAGTHSSRLIMYLFQSLMFLQRTC